MIELFKPKHILFLWLGSITISRWSSRTINTLFQHFGCSYHCVSNVMQVLYPLASVPLDITSSVTCEASPLQLRKLAFQIEANFFKALICICISLGFVCLLVSSLISDLLRRILVGQMKWSVGGLHKRVREKKGRRRPCRGFPLYTFTSRTAKPCLARTVFLQSFLQITLHDSSDKNLISVHYTLNG